MTTRSLVCVAVALSASLVQAQAVRISAPERWHLSPPVEAATNSPLGDLMSLKMNSDDVELRFWSTVYQRGTFGLILRRRAGEWSALRTKQDACTFAVQTLPAGGVSDSLKREYKRVALTRCGVTPGSGYHFSAMRLIFTRAVSLRGNPDSLWTRLLAAGLAGLPPTIKRNWISLHGQFIDIEYRSGNDYRATTIPCQRPPESDVDRQVNRIASLLFEQAHREWWLKCW